MSVQFSQVGKSGQYFSFPEPIRAQRDPTTSDIISPSGAPYQPGQEWINEVSAGIFTYAGGGVWSTSTVVHATETVAGIAELSTAAEAIAGVDDTTIMTPAKVALVAIAGAPLASEVTPGIAEIATQVETDAGVDDARIVTPLKLANFVGSGGFPGVFTDLTATGTVSFTGATGAINMTSATASSFGTTGAGIDLTLSSAAGRVIVNGEEAASNAITLLSVAGGIDVDAALQINIASSQNASDAIRIVTSAGGIDIDAVGAAGEDISILNTGGSVIISATENASDSIVISAISGGIDIIAAGGATEDIDIVNTAGSVHISSGEAVSDAITLSASTGGLTADSVGQLALSSSQNAADAILLTASAGGIQLLAPAASAGEDISIIATGSSVNIESTENAALAVHLHANGGVSETIRIRSDQGTGAASIDVLSDVGGITLTAGLATADAINIISSNVGGGIDIDSGSAGIAIDSTGAISLDAAAASNFSVTGAGIDLTLSSASGSIPISAGEAIANAIGLQAAAGGIDVNAALQINVDSSQAAADAIRMIASNAAGGIDIDAGTAGIAIDTTGALSLDSAAASNFTVTGAFDLTLQSSAGSVIVSASEAVADALQLLSTAGGIDILATGAAGLDIDIANTGGSTNISATEAIANAIVISASAGGIDILAPGAGAGLDIDIINTGGSVNITATEAIADSMVLTNQGMDIVTAGAAGRDIDITNTGGSINITATESISSAIVINASGAASGMSLDAGTAGLSIGTGMIVPVTAVAAGPYNVLGTDYVISADTGGGAFQINLPAAPETGRTYIIYDAGGAAAGANITISGNGNNIARSGATAATAVINTAYESFTMYFNGTIWLAQNVA